MLKVSKTGFINIIRCNRFAGLAEIYHKKKEGLVSFSENLDEVISADNEERKQYLLEAMFNYDPLSGEEEEDLIYPEDEQLAVMMDYYDEIETLAAQIVAKKFPGKITYHKETRLQKRFEMEELGYQFYAFLDGYLESENFNAVFESKATTTNKFLDIKVKGESLFTQNIAGIYQLKRELGVEVSKDFIKKEAVLFDKYSSVGGYVYDLAYQRLIIEKSSTTKKPTHYYLAVLNSDYIFDGKRDSNNEPLYSDEILAFIDLTGVTKRYLPLLEKDLKVVIDHLDEMNASEVPLGRHCQRKKTRECVFTPICFQKLPKNNILQYFFNHHGFKENGRKHLPYDLIKEGYLSMLDIPREWLSRPNNVIQYDVVKSGEPYYDKEKIRAGLNELKYPLYHLDFESFPCPLPRFKYETPHSQSLFQFSLHVEKSEGECDKEKDHYGFLAPDHQDRREELVVNLLKYIKPDGGSVTVYNAAFEKTRIRELGEMFPAYRERLQDISNRLFDIMDLVKTKTSFYQALGFDKERAKMYNFYDVSLEGSYSIKKVLPVFTNLSYRDLEIQNGNQAYTMYARFPNLNPEEYREGYANLIEYCKQDTWAMVEILRGIRKAVYK
ncbi:MAG: DUF2779 domain-containing protein [Acholeplasmataceae bacterium]|jgi:hypothetical protein|nr:DUF2779 domain-containing protein [Acholeplasmataceae bacterium]HHT39155.1 DUF2779 domain-containing protein [Acholeplasmataceae bacterium]